MNRRLLLLVVPPIVAVAGIGFFLVGGLGLFSPAPEYKPPIELQPSPIPAFTLTNQYGEKFSLESVRGKVILLYFGYTNCPDVCPLVMSKYAYVLKNLTPEERERVALIFVTVDPDRDTPEVMRKYVKLFDEEERIIALTGSKEELNKVWSSYGFKPVYTEKDEQGNYFVTHFAFVLVVDKNLVARYALTPELEPDEYLMTVRYMLRNY